MILQALARYYEILAADPHSGIAPFGYSTTGVSFALNLSLEGKLTGIIPLFQIEQRGKKTIEVPRRLNVPERVIRTMGVSSNFLCDNSAYVLGISDGEKSDPDYAAKRFAAFRDFNLRLLDDVECPQARAVAAFLRDYDPAQAKDDPFIVSKIEDLKSGGNLVFKLDGIEGFAHEAPEIRRAWEVYKSESGGETMAQCLVSGKWASVARLHPPIKGVKNAQATGASLVGFNAPAYESYARSQGENAQTSEKSAFAYAAALNYLLSPDSETPKIYLGDTTVVYWAESADPGYTELFSTLFDPDWAGAGEAASRRNPEAALRLREIARKVKSGEPLDVDRLMEHLDPNTRFYVLGLAPNAARLVVRFFHQDPFARIVRRIMAHYEDLHIQREFDNQLACIPARFILEETVSKKAKDKAPSPTLPGALMRSILNDTPYPAALFYAFINRIRADSDDSERRIRKINYIRAAVIKAYLTRKYRHQPQSQIQEVLRMSLNQESTHPAYLMGRLFAVLEKAQEEAIPNINATIKDRFFSSACASPVTVFPRLLRLSQHHIAKLEHPHKIRFERLLGQIMSGLQVEPCPFPAHLALDDQGVFVLGYYHQRAAFFVRRGDSPAAETITTEA